MSRLLLFWLCATTAAAFPIEYFQLGLTVPGFLSHLLPGSGTDSHRAAAAAPTRSAEEETIGWFDPRPNGGRLLDVSGLHRVGSAHRPCRNVQYTTKKYGEPLNIIISGASDPYVLTDEGFHVYAKCAASLLMA